MRNRWEDIIFMCDQLLKSLPRDHAARNPLAVAKVKARVASNKHLDSDLDTETKLAQAAANLTDPQHLLTIDHAIRLAQGE